MFSLGAQHAAGNRPQRAHPRPSDTKCSTQRLEDVASRMTRGSRRSGLAEDKTLSRLFGAARIASLMDGGGTLLHIVEVVTALSLRRAHRQPTRAGQLCWMRIWRIHRYDHLVIATPRWHQAGGMETIRIHIQGHQGYQQSTGSNEPGPIAGRPKLGLRWQESAHCWTGTTCRASVTRLLRMELGEGRQHRSG